MNNEQQNTNKKAYAAAQADYLDKLAQHCDYALTLQTNLPTYAISNATMEQRLDATRSSLNQFRLRLNRLLTGNGWLRNANMCPYLLLRLKARKTHTIKTERYTYT